MMVLDFLLVLACSTVSRLVDMVLVVMLVVVVVVVSVVAGECCCYTETEDQC